MQSRRLVLALALGCLAIVAVVTGVSSSASEMDIKVELDSFRELARNAPCANIDNRLFLIDEVVLFWTREGSCYDNWYEHALFGETPEKVMCQLHDSIAGPVYTCNDSTYKGMFWTMVHNLDREDLGLGPNHTVESIHF
jgi:hypothetical protein